MDTVNHTRGGLWGYENEDGTFDVRYWSGGTLQEEWPWYDGDQRTHYTTYGGLFSFLLTYTVGHLGRTVLWRSLLDSFGMTNPGDSSRDNKDGDDFVYVLSNQSGARILNHANNAVFKKGHRVHFGEEVALRLVRQHTTVPVPEIIMSSYEGEVGSIAMDFVPGSTLSSVWHSFDDQTKQKVCRNIWNFIMQWREIQRPTTLSHLYQCLADGSLRTRDPLIQDLNDPPTALESDEAVRARIYQRYLHFFGRRHEHDLPAMLPRSSKSVFTHGDVAPQNILIYQNSEIAGIIDWEHAGWYPDYWEYMNIMKPREDVDWKEWIDRTAPQRWDLSGIVAARRVLF